jgi:hypothetical protein
MPSFGNNNTNVEKLESNHFLKKICCPESRQDLHHVNGSFISVDGKYRYQISAVGVPLFAESFLTVNAERQRNHYDKVAAKYIENLQYPQTLEYLRYLDAAFLQEIKDANLTDVAEI